MPSHISITLFIVISVFASIGIVISFVFLAMNIKYRNQRYVRHIQTSRAELVGTIDSLGRVNYSVHCRCFQGGI